MTLVIRLGGEHTCACMRFEPAHPLDLPFAERVGRRHMEVDPGDEALRELREKVRRAVAIVGADLPEDFTFTLTLRVTAGELRALHAARDPEVLSTMLVRRCSACGQTHRIPFQRLPASDSRGATHIGACVNAEEVVWMRDARAAEGGSAEYFGASNEGGKSHTPAGSPAAIRFAQPDWHDGAL